MALPAGWTVDRIRDRTSGIVGGEWGDDPDDGGESVDISVIRVADIRDLDVETSGLTLRRIKHSKVAERLVGPQTILLEKSGGGENKSVGRAVRTRRVTFDAICSNFMAKFDCLEGVDSSFVVYAMHGLYSCGANEAHIQQTTGIQNLRVFDYLNTEIAFPPVAEQHRIAAFLDASCAAIDAAVAAKRGQVEILDFLRNSMVESRFAGFSREADERVKDVALKITSGVTPDGGAAGYLDAGVPFLRSQNVHFDGLRLEDVAYISADTHASMRGSQLKSRDVLLNITGASIGRCAIVPDGFGEGNVNQHVCIIRPGPCVDHRFLAAFLSSPRGQDQIFSTFTGASRQGLSHSDLGLIRIPLPKMAAQREIVAHIEEHDQRHGRLHNCLSEQITTLTAYRKSLIHECVTGQRRITDADLQRLGAPP
jgi:type I restriction enzyme S subunit